ncbi:autophagy-related protein 9A-like isoform X2 [Watersipora subatra]|uniref:autophagy-related protein 9A-like isoform X2 n=1 Tax=Watersipora subatra TaxID=2589382 RepID=UPI00355C6331
MAGREYVTGYQPYQTDSEDGAPSQFYVEDEEAPVFVRQREQNPAARWHHIENLDDFFSRLYTYHQRHGFFCMAIEDACQLIQFLIIVLFAGFLTECVDYGILFATEESGTKHSFADVIITPCSCGFSIPTVAICILIALAFFLTRALLYAYNLTKYWEMRQFYRHAMNIDPDELDNKTWSEVQSKLIEAQRNVQMCIYNNELTPLDIHHRILRYKNFFIAMINKSVIPVKFSLPFIGRFTYLSNGLKTTIEWLLFWRPFSQNISPFKDPYFIKEDFKSIHRRVYFSDELSRKILIVALLSLIFSPVIFLWQILYLFFVYGSIVKNEPGFLGSRKWSLYARAHLRHFNELDHELNARLCRAYQVSNDYLSGFMSPLIAVLAKFVSFVAGAVLVVLICFTVYDEDTLQIEHMLTVITACGVVLSTCRIFIPPENMVFVPEAKMIEILAHTHYQPIEWKDKAHTSQVREEFGQLFEFKAVFLLHELLSPLITPFILIFKLRPKSMEIVDFYRNFSVDVAGLGDICSFAQLDIRKHGNNMGETGGEDVSDDSVETYMQAEGGKVELSLMNFSLNNPTWAPPEQSARYLQSIRESAARDCRQTTTARANPLTDSVLGWASSRRVMDTSAMGASLAGVPGSRSGGMYGSISNKVLRGTLTQQTGPLSDQPIPGGIIDAMAHSNSYEGFTLGIPSSEYNSSEMSLSALYMHELRRRKQRPHVGHTGYEDLGQAREVLTDSELQPVPQFHTIDEELHEPPSSSSSYTNQQS